MAKRKDTFNNLKKSYYIALLGGLKDQDGECHHTVKYVTDYEYYPHKTAYWTAGKPAHRFDDWETAQNVAFGLMCNGYGAVIVQSLLGSDGSDLMSNAFHNFEEKETEKE